MADQKTTDASISNAVKTFYTKNILEDFERTTAYYQQAPVREVIPEGEGKTIEFTRYKQLPVLRTDNPDEFTATQLRLSSEIVTATLRERDGFVQLSKLLKLTAIGKPMDRAAMKIKGAARRTLDTMIRNDIGMVIADVANASSLNFENLSIDGGPSNPGTLNSTGTTARIWSHDAAAAGDRFPVYHNKLRVSQSALVTSIAKTALTPKTVMHGISVLHDSDIPPLDDGMYRLLVHTTVAFQISTSTAYKGWISPTSSDPLRNTPTEIGVIGGARVISTNMSPKFPLSGDTLSTSSGAMFCSLLFGDEAYGVTELNGASGGRDGFEFFINESGPQTTSDPTRKKKQVAFSITAVGKVLNKSAALWLLSTEQT